MTDDESLSSSKEESIGEQASRICEREGQLGWRLAQEAVLQEETTSQKLQKAIRYVMCEYKPDYFRPALMALCSQSVGGSAEATAYAAASCVLWGRAIGIHDDIIDGSRRKNDRPTVFGAFGRDLALVLSDILLFTGFTLTRRAIMTGMSPKRLGDVLATIERVWYEQSEGEVLELESRQQATGHEECLEKIRMRASELEAITRIGGIIGGGSIDEVDALGRYGRSIGIMSILRDETVDMLEFNVLRHRIKRESLPIPLVFALEVPKQGPEIASLISTKNLRRPHLWRISKASEEAGGLDYTATLIDEYSKKALSCVRTLRGKKEELETLVMSIRIGPEDWRPVLSAK